VSYYQNQPTGVVQDPNNLDLPLYGATFSQAFVRFWKKYATFSGRASRSEYWWWALIGALVGILTTSLDIGASGSLAQANADLSGPGDIINAIFGLATIIPSLALAVRRLHDTNRSGWWILIGLVPLVGWIILLVFYVSGPNPAGARYDRNPAPQSPYPTQPYA
jgi:uncharacterized membrane protein YhaH (DUF805 family)